MFVVISIAMKVDVGRGRLLIEFAEGEKSPIVKAGCLLHTPVNSIKNLLKDKGTSFHMVKRSKGDGV